MARQPLDIKTCESAPDSVLGDNILENLEIMPSWIDAHYTPHNGHALMISAGHSFTKRPGEALNEITGGPLNSRFKTFCIKHCLPYFENMEYKPDYCVALDPRPLEGNSTLGYERKGLYKIYPETTYLIASMTHPSVTKYLLDNGAKVVGWHSLCAGSEDPRVIEKEVPAWIMGGSCSAMRGINVARVFGFREVTLLGYDSSFDITETVYQITKKRSKELTLALELLQAQGIPVDYNKIMEDKLATMAPTPEQRKMMDDLAAKGFKVETPNLKGADMVIPVVVGNFKSVISPEIAAQVKDLEYFFQTNEELTIHNASGGFCKALFDALGGEAKINPAAFNEKEKTV